MAISQPPDEIVYAQEALDKALKRQLPRRLANGIALIIGLLGMVLTVEILTLDLTEHAALLDRTFSTFSLFAALLFALLLMDLIMGSAKESRHLATMAQNLGRTEERYNQQRQLLDTDLYEELITCYRECKNCTARELCKPDGIEGNDCETSQCIKGLEVLLGLSKDSVP